MAAWRMHLTAVSRGCITRRDRLHALPDLINELVDAASEEPGHVGVGGERELELLRVQRHELPPNLRRGAAGAWVHAHGGGCAIARVRGDKCGARAFDWIDL